jgi:hypothetical protein
MACCARITEDRPNGVTTLEEDRLGKGSRPMGGRKGEEELVLLNTIDSDMVLEEGNRVNRVPLIDKNDILTLTVGFCTW